MSKEFMLTTNDNPYDPFDEFDKWFEYDHANGHNCCEYLSEIALTTDNLMEKSNNQIIEEAIDEIIKYNPLKIYKKVSRDIS